MFCIGKIKWCVNLTISPTTPLFLQIFAAIRFIVPAMGFARDGSETDDRPGFVDMFDQDGDGSVSESGTASP